MSHYSLIAPTTATKEALSRTMLPYYQSLIETDVTEVMRAEYEISKSPNNSFRNWVVERYGFVEVDSDFVYRIDFDGNAGKVGGYVVLNSGNVDRCISLGNPDTRWGHYSMHKCGFFKHKLLKNHRRDYTVSASAADIDWVGMKEDVLEDRRRDHSAFRNAYDSIGHVEDVTQESDYIKFCLQHPGVFSSCSRYVRYVSAMKAIGRQDWGSSNSLEMLMLPEDEYVSQGEIELPFAFIDLDGRWCQQTAITNNDVFVIPDYKERFWNMVSEVHAESILHYLDVSFQPKQPGLFTGKRE